MSYCRFPNETCVNMTFFNGKIYCDNPDGFCHLHDEEPPMTNADRIRSMSNEELAKFLMGEPVNYCHTGLCLDGETCVGCYLKWLRQPAEEDIRK